MGSVTLSELVYPIVVGLVLLVGQFFIQPRIARREHFDRARWDAKRDLYSRAIRLVNTKFASIGGWTGKDVPPEAATVIPGIPPTPEDVNQCYAELALYSNRDIVRAYAACFGKGGADIMATHRMELIAAMRRDLGISDSDLEAEDTWFVLKP